MPKHVAGSGARAGQWVNCTAKNSCRLGGTHISERELYAAGAWLNETGDKKRLSQITKEDVENFQNSTKGQEEEWAKKAELAARRAKGIKGANYQVFAGEKNLVKVPEPKKFVPNTGKAKAPVAPVLPPGTRYIEIPDVARFMNRGDTTALARAIKQYGIPRDTVEALASLRVRMTNNAPNTSLYTNEETGESCQGSEIPEVKEFLRTGDESKLDEATKKYGIGGSYVDILKASQKRHEKQMKKDARWSKRAPAPRSEDSTATGLRAAAQKMKEASARLTNVTDDLSELTSEKKPSNPASSGKTIYEALAEAKKVSERAARNNPRSPADVRSEPSTKTSKVVPVEESAPIETPADKIVQSVGKFMDRFRK